MYACLGSICDGIFQFNILHCLPFPHLRMQKEVRIIALRIVRGLTIANRSLALDESPEMRAIAIYNASIAMSLLAGTSLPQTYKSCLSIEDEAILQKHGAALNPTQRQALQNAFRFGVSACRGPPGTGKTRTISAIAESFRDAGKRVLIMAPANAATQRALECIVDAGYKSAVLIVSQEYFFEWHEDSYHERLRDHVVTPRRSEPANGTQSSMQPPRSSFELGKWTNEVAGIVILTYGAAVSNMRQDSLNRKASAWAGAVKKLVQWDSIGAVIVDETSQLWEGHSLGLFSKLSHAKHFVIVGDENQLAPYGSDQNMTLEKLRSITEREDSETRIGSLFDLVTRHPQARDTSVARPANDSKMLPIQMLETTYRLPHSIGELISNMLYQNRLTVHRNAEKDTNTANLLRAVATLLSRLNRVGICTVHDLSKSLIDSCISQPILAPSASSQHSKDGRTCWVDLAGTEAKLDTSSYNELEAKIVGIVAAELDYAFFKVHHQNGGHGEALRVVVISPYEAQRKRIEDWMAKRLVEVGRFFTENKAADYVRSSKFCNNIDGFQGQEADIVLVSLVRTESVGFLNDERRANVMLSRCREALFVFGHLAHWSSQTSAQLVAKVADMCISQELVFNLPSAQFNSSLRVRSPSALANVTNTLSVSDSKQALNSLPCISIGIDINSLSVAVKPIPVIPIAPAEEATATATPATPAVAFTATVNPAAPPLAFTATMNPAAPALAITAAAKPVAPATEVTAIMKPATPALAVTVAAKPAAPTKVTAAAKPATPATKATAAAKPVAPAVVVTAAAKHAQPAAPAVVATAAAKPTAPTKATAAAKPATPATKVPAAAKPVTPATKATVAAKPVAPAVVVTVAAKPATAAANPIVLPYPLLRQACEIFVASSPNRTCPVTYLASAMIFEGHQWTGKLGKILQQSSVLEVYFEGISWMVRQRLAGLSGLTSFAEPPAPRSETKPLNEDSDAVPASKVAGNITEDRSDTVDLASFAGSKESHSSFSSFIVHDSPEDSAANVGQLNESCPEPERTSTTEEAQAEVHILSTVPIGPTPESLLSTSLPAKNPNSSCVSPLHAVDNPCQSFNKCDFDKPEVLDDGEGYEIDSVSYAAAVYPCDFIAAPDKLALDMDNVVTIVDDPAYLDLSELLANLKL
jgi:hypothetical protein